jgi:hypothetical protein
MPVAKCAVVRSRETTTSWPSRDPSLKVASFIVARLSVLSNSMPSASRRWPFFVAAIAAVLAVHALLLFAWAPAWIDPEEPPSPAPALAVRSVALPPVPVAAPVEVAPAPAPAAKPPVPKVARATPPKVPASAPVPPVVTPPVEVAAAPAPVVVEVPAVAVEPASAPTIDVPVYATRLPAPGTWRYALSRGIASGDAQLSWRPDEQSRYEMRLEGFIAGLAVLDWVSTGAIDAAGIAPERFVIRRRGRDSQAANFQRDAGKITWSGPTHEVPIVPGVQDRLSWMLQLPAVVEAAPQRFGAGTNVVLMVIGARGGADVWTFRVSGADTVDGTPTLKLVREARKPRDVHVEVWLDPARGHIPLRALLTQPDGGAPFELVLQPGSTGP